MSVDIAPLEIVLHPRVTCVKGSSVDPAVVQQVRERLGGGRALVILDSDHSAAHVAKKHEVYAPLVPVGGHLLVQDGCIDDLAINTRHAETGLGPRPAIKRFLAENPSFERAIDVERKYVMAAHPYG